MKKQKTKIGFTLIELLVVVAIIAVLVAILLPALAKSREQARRILCLSQIKQVATAALMYAGVNNDNFPPTFWAGREWPQGLSCGSPQGMLYRGPGLLYHLGYLGKGTVLWCPALGSNAPYSLEKNYPYLDVAFTDFCYGSYCYRCSTIDFDGNGFDPADIKPNSEFQGLRLSSLDRPKAVMADYFLHGSSSYSSHISHDGTGIYNVAYTDGSARPYNDTSGKINGIGNGYGYAYNHSFDAYTHIRAWIEIFDGGF